MFCQTQSHRQRLEEDVFKDRFAELDDLQKLMDSDGVRQTNYQILRTIILPSHTHILADLFFNENKASS